MDNNYQTYKSTNGEIVQGVFDTHRWFEIISSIVDFPGKTVLDLGCAEGEFSRLSISKGANLALGVDTNSERIDFARYLTSNPSAVFECADIDEIRESSDVTIASMILHWSKDPVSLLARLQASTSKYIVIVFREANDNYLPTHGSWFPTLSELDSAMSRSVRVFTKVLETQDNGKKVVLAIYRTDFCIVEDRVIKRVNFSEDHLNMLNRLIQASPAANVRATRIYYETILLKDYSDLYGRISFNFGSESADFYLEDDVRLSIIRALYIQLRACLKAGVMLSDISRRNIMFLDRRVAFIDYDDLSLVAKSGLIGKAAATNLGSVLDYLDVPNTIALDRKLKKCISDIERVMNV